MPGPAAWPRRPRSRQRRAGGSTNGEIELAELLCDRVPAVDRIRFCNSGTEAWEGAMKFARRVGRGRRVLFLDDLRCVRPYDRNVECVHDDDRDDQRKHLEHELNRNVFLVHRSAVSVFGNGSGLDIRREWNRLVGRYVLGRNEILFLRILVTIVFEVEVFVLLFGRLLRRLWRIRSARITSAAMRSLRFCVNTTKD